MQPIDIEAIARDLEATARVLSGRYGQAPVVVRLNLLAGVVRAVRPARWDFLLRVNREIDAIRAALQEFPLPEDKRQSGRLRDTMNFIAGFVARERPWPEGRIRPGAIKGQAFEGTGRIRPSDKPFHKG